MQCIYAWDKGVFQSVALAEKSLLKSISNAYDILLYNLYVLRLIGEQAHKEADQRAAKKLRTEHDFNFNTRLADNTIIAELTNNKVFSELVKDHKLHLLVNADHIKQMFRNLLEHKEYKKYLAISKPSWEDESAIVMHIYNKVLLAYEPFADDLEEHFLNWIDDQTSVNFRMNQLLGEKDFAAELGKRSQFIPDEEDEEFAGELLEKTLANEEEFKKLIEPKLQNWDMERIASLDMILMKMALCELIHFRNIPIKVSINEYIDISKIYSTPKSKDFINGVLDKLMNQLKEEGLINKQGRGLLGN